jgi:hypothetical protein
MLITTQYRNASEIMPNMTSEQFDSPVFAILLQISLQTAAPSRCKPHTGIFANCSIGPLSPRVYYDATATTCAAAPLLLSEWQRGRSMRGMSQEGNNIS